MPPILDSSHPLGAHLAGIKYPHADILGIADRLPEDEQSKLATIHEFLQTEIRPVVGEFWDREELPFDLLPTMAACGYLMPARCAPSGWEESRIGGMGCSLGPKG